jgi:hypothetical protein
MKNAVVGVVLALGLLLGGCGVGQHPGAIPAGQNPQGEPAPSYSPVLGLASPTAKSSAQKLADSRQRAQAAAKKAKKAANSLTKDVTFVMPKLVGRNLQASQDQLQSLGSYLLHEEDASGAGRYTLLDRDWRVCSQVPKPGVKVSRARIVVLRAVKLSEKCP